MKQMIPGQIAAHVRRNRGYPAQFLNAEAPGPEGSQGLQGQEESRGLQERQGSRGLQGQEESQGLQGPQGSAEKPGHRELQAHKGRREPQGHRGHREMRGPGGLRGRPAIRKTVRLHRFGAMSFSCRKMPAFPLE